MVVNVDEDRRAKLLRRDPDLARLVDRLSATGAVAFVDDLTTWALARDADRRSIASEALDRYRELNLLYDLAERSASLDPEAILAVATAEIGRVSRRGTSLALLIDEKDGRLHPMNGSATMRDGFVLGEGIVGSIAAAGDGEIVNHPQSDRRATQAEIALGALTISPLRAGDRRLGVLLVADASGTEFTAGEHRMLSAVAALTAPALDAALTHVKTVAQARAREQELERQLETLRNEVEAARREERVSEITGTEYFQALRRQADDMRRALKSGTGRTKQ